MTDVNTDHRQRILMGMAQAIAAKGYADTTIADIVREAKVSRRTFYEHFASQSDCLFALYDIGSQEALQVLKGTLDITLDWPTQIDHAITAYFSFLSQDLVMLRTLIVEIHKLGAEGLAARRKSICGFAELIQRSVQARAENRPEAWLSDELAMAAVGGIHELILNAIEQKQESQLMKLREPSCRLILALIGAGK